MTTTFLLVIGIVVALILLASIWVGMRVWRERRREQVRREHQLGSVYNSRTRHERGG